MAMSMEFVSLASLKLLLGSALIYMTCKAIWRLYFHPLSKVPGPWYAAISSLNEFYWDCVVGGKYLFKIEEMHKKYGNLTLSF